MDTISTSELIELAYIERDYFALQFEYWLAITFATITAAYIAGDKLSTWVRRCLLFLYLLSTIFFWSLYGLASDTYLLYKTEIEARGFDILASPEEATFVGVLRVILWMAGTIIASWFLLRGGLSSARDREHT